MADPVTVLTLVVLYVADIDASRRFYAGLGLSFAAEQQGSGPEHFAAALPAGAVLELYPAGDRPPTGPGSGSPSLGPPAG